MIQAGRRFRPGLWLTSLTLIGAVILAALGTWQVQRMGWKHDLIATAEHNLALPPVPLPVEPASIPDLQFRPVETSGTLRYDKAQVFGVEGRGNIVGARLLVPLERPAGPPVLVDMGWVPEPVESVLARLNEPQASQRVTGYARLDHHDTKPPFKPDNDVAGRRWYWNDTAALALATGLDDLAALTLVRTPDGTDTEPPIADPPMVDFRDNHLGYALTWYGLCAALIGVYVAYGLSGRGESNS